MPYDVLDAIPDSGDSQYQQVMLPGATYSNDYLMYAYHSIFFTDPANNVGANTWADWHLVPLKRPTLAPPEIKTEYIDIPGADGSLDFTGALNGVRYKDRQGSWEFMVVNGYGKWYDRYSQLLNYLHGKKLLFRFADEVKQDPNLANYRGRFSVNAWESGDHYTTVTINYYVEPFRVGTNTF